MPIGRLELAEFGRFVSGKYRFLECVDFEVYLRTQSVNRPLNIMGVRGLWGKNGVRRLWGISLYYVFATVFKTRHNAVDINLKT